MTPPKRDRPRRAHHVAGLSASLNPPGSLESRFVARRPGLILNFGYAQAWVAVGSDRARRQAFRPHSLSFWPGGADVSNQNETTSEFLLIEVEHGHFNALAAPVDAAVPRHCVFDLIGPGVEALAQEARRLALNGPGGADQLSWETLVLGLSEHVLAAAAGRGAAPPRTTRLDGGRVARVLELIEADLAADLSVVTLAETVGMSATHFAHAFKAALGQPPHAFVLERRIARARDLLAASDLSLVEIAHTVGFSSQSHMTTAFGRTLGVTPRGYRDGIGS